MPNNHKSGRVGEIEVVKLLPCPNCGKRLMQLPKGYPLYDVQCEGCSFRAQVKTNNCKPKSEVYGAGWDIMSKVLKSGYMVPPLILNFKWMENGKRKQELRFYPFIPKKSLYKYKLSENHSSHPNYMMFRYTKLDVMPYFVSYKK